MSEHAHIAQAQDIWTCDPLIRESYLANYKKLPPDAVKVVVTATARSPLAPSWKLLNTWRAKPRKISWQKYERAFRTEIYRNPVALKRLRELKELGHARDVYLICYEKRFPCHRFILMDIINEL